MRENITALPVISEEDKLDKTSYVPAYAQLASILRQKISKGIYQPGAQLPSEAAIASGFGISAMTARQAIGILAEEGLVERIQGRGTFVKRLKFTSSNFGLDSLRQIFIEKEKLEVLIINASVKVAPKEIRKKLQLESGSSVIVVERLILHDKKPVIYQISYALADPESPFVETMLETNVLTGFLLEKELSSFKKAEFKLLPNSLKQNEAELLHLKAGESVFKLEHTYYGFNDLPSACGWFLIEPGKMPLICRMGVWNDD
jgi:GntR family transcriptional regulator